MRGIASVMEIAAKDDGKQRFLGYRVRRVPLALRVDIAGRH
jgi:hypothetical protein